MKFQKSLLLSALVSASLFVSCGNKNGTDTNNGTTTNTPVGATSLSSSFGLVLSQQLKNNKFPVADLNFADFEKGLGAGLKNEPYDGLNMQAAQLELQNKSQNQPAPKFSAALGLLIGADLIVQGVLSQDINPQEFAKAMESGIQTTPDSLTLVNAQQQVEKVMKAAQEKKAQAGKDFLVENAKKPGVVTTASGLQYEIIKDAKGKKPTLTDKVKVHYHGTLIDGTVFDSSVERGEPISFALNGVIKGWQEGVALMPVGSKYKLYIPSELGYGGNPAGKIPPFSTLIFEVELLAIEK